MYLNYLKETTECEEQCFKQTMSVNNH